MMLRLILLSLVISFSKSQAGIDCKKVIQFSNFGNYNVFCIAFLYKNKFFTAGYRDGGGAGYHHIKDKALVAHIDYAIEGGKFVHVQPKYQSRDKFTLFKRNEYTYYKDMVGSHPHDDEVSDSELTEIINKLNKKLKNTSQDERSKWDENTFKRIMKVNP